MTSFLSDLSYITALKLLQIHRRQDISLREKNPLKYIVNIIKSWDAVNKLLQSKDKYFTSYYVQLVHK